MLQINIYDKTGVKKDTLSEKEIASEDLQFGSQIDSGQRDCSIEIYRETSTLSYISGDIIEIVEYNDDNKDGHPLYTGYFFKKYRSIKGKTPTTKIDIYGILSVLSDYPFISGGSYNFSLTLDPKAMIQAVIDSFNSQCPFVGTDTENLGSTLVYMSASSENFGSSVNISFDNLNCKDAIKKIVEKTNFHFFLYPTGELLFRAKPSASTHVLKQKTHTAEIYVEELSEDIVNCVRIKRASGQIKYYSDAASIALYGKRYGGLITKSDIEDEPTLDTFGNSYISENKDIKTQATITLKNDYKNIIYPGEIVQIVYGDVSINNSMVHRVDFSKDKRVLHLEKYQEIGKLFNL